MYFFESAPLMTTQTLTFHPELNYYPNALSSNEIDPNDERFLGIIPFIAGLAVAPLFFNNRPCCPPFPPYPLYPPAYPPYPGPFPAGYNQQQSFQNPIYGGVTENINIYTQ